MKLHLVTPFKSIRYLPSIDLPDFVVLTGVNGAGKSHLLQALEAGAVQIEGIPFNQQARSVRRFDWSNLVPNDTGAFAAFQSKQERAQMWQQFSSLSMQLRAQVEQISTQNPALAKMNVKDLVKLTDDDLIAGYGYTSEQASATTQAIKNSVSNASQILNNNFVQPDPNNRPRLLSSIQATTALPLIAFDEDDFYDNFPASWQPVDMFQQSFSRLFAEYQANWRDNEFKKFRNTKGAKHAVLDETQFVAKYGTPPWTFVNSILEAAGLGFRIDAPDEVDDRPYEALLTDQLTEVNVKFNDLSSGERVLMSFALCLYYAKDKRQIVEYPHVILLDEIDAPLHPSMTQSLLRTIQNVLIDQHKIKVILTTHSPSTVAIAPEESLYAMRKGHSDRLIKTTKDSALSILMSGVPTVSISYENRRQVFVESHHDVSFYELFYEKLKTKLVPEISISFIASSGSKIGGCAHVKDVVGQLSSAGNKTVRGLIDWDLSNKREGSILVLGEGQRYSIENYIFDPILVAILLFLDRIVSRAEIGLQESESHMDFAKMDNTRLQYSVDFVVNKLASNTPLSGDNKVISCSYIGGCSVNIPEWVLHMQGHNLEELLKKTFPQLKAYRGEDKLKKEILKRVIDDLPSLIPQCVLDVFLLIQSA